MVDKAVIPFKPDVVFYHFPCADGFGAAVVAKRLWPNVKYVPINYGEGIPRVLAEQAPAIENKHVLFLDFFPGARVCKSLVDTCESVTVLDHHEGAALDIANLNIWAVEHQLQFFGKFDNERSGIGLAWDYIFDGVERPRMVELLEDRDLWRFRYGDETKNLHAFLTSLSWDFSIWHTILQNYEEGTTRADMILAQGGAIRRAQTKWITEWIENQVQWWVFWKLSEDDEMPSTPWQQRATRTKRCGENETGYVVPVLNIPGIFASEAGHMLLEAFPDAAFAATYCDHSNERRWSLRSEDGRESVIPICKARGGGGHRNAGGFEEMREGDETKVCPECDGSGGWCVGPTPNHCPECGGSGRVPS